MVGRYSVGILVLVACSGKALEPAGSAGVGGGADTGVSTGAGVGGGGGDTGAGTGGGGTETGVGPDTGVVDTGTGSGGGGSSADKEYECGSVVKVTLDNTFGEEQYYGSDYDSVRGGSLCKCTADVTEALPSSVTPIGITVYQQGDHLGSTNWNNTSSDTNESWAPGYVHVTFPSSDSGSITTGSSYNNSDSDSSRGGGPNHNKYEAPYWSAFPNTPEAPFDDSNKYGFPNPFKTSSAMVGEFTLRLSMVNAEASTTDPGAAATTRSDWALPDCSAYIASPTGIANSNVIFRIDTTIDTSDSKGADPRSNPGTIAFTEVLLQELLPGRTVALAQRGAVGVLGAEALMVEVQSWSQHSWVELRDRSGRVHRLSPSRPRIELPPNTGAIESLTWTYGSEIPASPGALGPTLRIRHRGPNTPSPAAAFRLSWRGLLEAANRAVGAPLAIPGFNPLPDWTALTFGLDGLAPGQDNPTLTLNTPLSGALFTLPLTPAPHHTFTWSIQNPYVQITGQLQEQRGPRLGVWVDEARVSSPFGDLTLLPTHVLVEMDHVGQ